VRQLTRRTLERAGYRVLEASNAVEALRIWAKHEGAIDLLMTDIVMPEGINGRELAERLYVHNPRLRVVLTSGYSADIAGQELSLRPGHAFLQKPATPRFLLDCVRRCLDG
jgi:two-component system cell cycle sensor histidine kinase/response regulator CckA